MNTGLLPQFPYKPHLTAVTPHAPDQGKPFKSAKCTLLGIQPAENRCWFSFSSSGQTHPQLHLKHRTELGSNGFNVTYPDQVFGFLKIGCSLV